MHVRVDHSSDERHDSDNNQTNRIRVQSSVEKPLTSRPQGRSDTHRALSYGNCNSLRGGGSMATLAGRVFEKAGVHTSTVFGTFAPEFAGQIPGADTDPHFWASGISLIIHPWSPHVPTVHMNTRFVCTVARGLARLAGVQPTGARWRTVSGPTFDNSIAVLELDERAAQLTISRSCPEDEDGPVLQVLHRRQLA